MLIFSVLCIFAQGRLLLTAEQWKLWVNYGYDWHLIRLTSFIIASSPLIGHHIIACLLPLAASDIQIKSYWIAHRWVDALSVDRDGFHTQVTMLVVSGCSSLFHYVFVFAINTGSTVYDSDKHFAKTSLVHRLAYHC